MLSNVEDALQRQRLLLPFFPFFFFTYSVHIDQGSEHKRGTRLWSESPSSAGTAKLQLSRAPE